MSRGRGTTAVTLLAKGEQSRVNGANGRDSAGTAFPRAAQEVGYRAVDHIVDSLSGLGVRQVFGVIGGAIAPLADAIGRSHLRFTHFRHEAGAAFAGVEASLLSGEPVAVITTTGPGLLNAINGAAAGRWDGARLLFISAVSGAQHQGRLPVQESSPFTMPGDLYRSGPLFDEAAVLHDIRQWPDIERRFAIGLTRPQGFVAHVGLPTPLQSLAVSRRMQNVSLHVADTRSSVSSVPEVVEALSREPFAIWVGYGARRAHRGIRDLAEKSKAPVMCTPRGKGIFPESHPLFIGVTGAGGHETAARFMTERLPQRVLVLGTRLGEASSSWDRRLIPERGLIHIDVDRGAFGKAFPGAETLGVQADVGSFIDSILPSLPERRATPTPSLPPPFPEPTLPESGRSPVRMSALFSAIQRYVVDGSDAVVLTESGNAFGFGNHLLKFDVPDRYRTSAAWGSMGHMTCGVIGAVLARNLPAVAIVGDGAMLMNNEINTAVQEDLPAVWIILNDSGFGIVRDGMAGLGLKATKCDIPTVDFAMLARSMGASGMTVIREDELEDGLTRALSSGGPFVLDVRIGREISPAIAGRVQLLLNQQSATT